MTGYGQERRNRVRRSAVAVAVFAAAIGVAGPTGAGRAAVSYRTSTALTCEPPSVVVGNASVCTATVIDTASGRLTPTGSVSFASDAPGSFGAGGACVLASTDTAGTASCQESYSPSAVASGTHTITAGYAGDRLHAASSGATTVAATENLTAEPPIAAIDSPADGYVAKLGSSVGTGFSCTEGPNGPGVTSCSDSGGASGGSGQLDTGQLGVHTYTVTAISGDGQTAAATIQYTVSRMGRPVRPVVNLPTRLLNAAVQPCAVIVCSGNLRPHDQLMNSFGSYCQQYDCSYPMDLVPSNGLDPNLFPFNPDWTSYLVQHEPPFALEYCGQFIRSQFDSHFPRCTSQAVGLDKATSFAGQVCKRGRDPADAFHGHVNYEPATYEGRLYFFEKSAVGTDDEYSLDLVPSKPDGVTHYNNAAPPPVATAPNAIHIEFDSDETVDHYDNNPWWKDFHSKVDDKLPYRAVDGNRAEVTGLVGLDTVHSASAEIHPVYAIAIQTYPGSPGWQPGADQWAFFARRSGNEGYCSSNQHYLPAAPLTVRIPWPAGATGVSIPSSDVHWAGNGSDVSASVVPNYGVLLKFQLPPPQAHNPLSGSSPMYWGTANFRWSYPPGATPARSAAPERWWSPPPAGDRWSPVTSPLAHPRRSTRRSGREVDVESLVGRLFARLPAAKRKQARAMVPRPIGTLPHTRRGGIQMLAPSSERLSAPGPFVFPRVGLAVRKRDAAELRALCWAYANHIPGFERACLQPKR